MAIESEITLPKTGLFVPADDLPPHDQQSWSVEAWQDRETLEVFQRLVGGYIEAVSLPEYGVTMWVNEDGIAKGLPPNRLGSFLYCTKFDGALATLTTGSLDGFLILGDIFITGKTDDEGELSRLEPSDFGKIVSVLNRLGVKSLTND